MILSEKKKHEFLNFLIKTSPKTAKTGGPKSAILNGGRRVAGTGRVGSGRVGSGRKRDSATDPLPRRAHEQNTPFGQTLTPIFWALAVDGGKMKIPDHLARVTFVMETPKMM